MKKRKLKEKDGCAKPVLTPAGLLFQRPQRLHQAGFQGVVDALAGHRAGFKGGGLELAVVSLLHFCNLHQGQAFIGQGDDQIVLGEGRQHRKGREPSRSLGLNPRRGEGKSQMPVKKKAKKKAKKKVAKRKTKKKAKKKAKKKVAKRKTKKKATKRKAKKKTKAKKPQQTSWRKKCPKCGTEVHVRKRVCPCGQDFGGLGKQ